MEPQGQAEFYLERLHGVTEKELEGLALEESRASPEEWSKFREKLIGLTDVTKSHFEKLVQVQGAALGCRVPECGRAASFRM